MEKSDVVYVSHDGEYRKCTIKSVTDPEEISLGFQQGRYLVNVHGFGNARVCGADIVDLPPSKMRKL